MIFCHLEAMHINQQTLQKIYYQEKKNQIKLCYRILVAELLSYEEVHCKTTQISRVNELYPAKQKYSRQFS